MKLNIQNRIEQFQHIFLQQYKFKTSSLSTFTLISCSTNQVYKKYSNYMINPNQATRPFEKDKRHLGSHFIPFAPKLNDVIKISLNSDFDYQLRIKTEPSLSAIVRIIRKNGETCRFKPTYIQALTKKIDFVLNQSLRNLKFNGLVYRKALERFVMAQEESCSNMLTVECKSSRQTVQLEIKKNQACSFIFNPGQMESTAVMVLQASTTKIRQILGIFGIIKASFRQNLKKHQFELQTAKQFQRIIQNNSIIEETNFFKNSQNQNPVVEVLQVLEEQDQITQQFPIKRGGYFNVSRKRVKIPQKECPKGLPWLEQKIIAQKMLRKTKKLGTVFNYEGKIAKQIQMLDNLKGLSKEELENFAKYYTIKRVSNTSQCQKMQQQNAKTSQTLSNGSCSIHSNGLPKMLHMEYYRQSLQEYINKKGRLDIEQALNFLKQILETVKLLHGCGVIHRDLKPGNFMLQKCQNGSIKTKLIDFGQSTHQKMQFSPSSFLTLGFSIPYAPIQCTVECKAGFNKKQIDYWSLGVLIFELVKGRIPVNYSKCFKGDINKGWPTQLSFFIHQNGYSRVSTIEKILLITAQLFMRVDPKNRLGPEKGLQIINYAYSLIDQLKEG